MHSTAAPLSCAAWGKKVLILLLALFVGAAIGFGYWYYRNVSERIRSLDDPALAGITILAMTANAFDEDRKKALACGMDGFLSKPIVIEELISTLQNSLG